MTPVEVLRATHRKLSQGWTQRTSARSANGTPVSALSDQAVCWCVYGAAVTTGASIDDRLAAYAYLRLFTNGAAVDAFNDLPDQTKVDVLCWIERGIEAAEREAA